MIQCSPWTLVFPVSPWDGIYRNGMSHGIEMDISDNTIPYVSNVHIYFKYHNPSKKKYLSKIPEGTSSGGLRAVVHRPEDPILLYLRTIQRGNWGTLSNWAQVQPNSPLKERPSEFWGCRVPIEVPELPVSWRSPYLLLEVRDCWTVFEWTIWLLLGLLQRF